MSLLMEALRKAEEAKRKAAENSEDAKSSEPSTNKTNDGDRSSTFSPSARPAEPHTESTTPKLSLEERDDSPFETPFDKSIDTAEATTEPTTLDEEKIPELTLEDLEPEEDSLADVKSYVNEIGSRTIGKPASKIDTLDYKDESDAQDADLNFDELYNRSDNRPNNQIDNQALIREQSSESSSNQHLEETKLIDNFNEFEHNTTPLSDYETLQEERKSAGAIFQAKQNSSTNNRKFAIALIVIILLVPTLGGVYWFYNAYFESSSSIPVASLPPGRFLGDPSPNLQPEEIEPGVPQTQNTTTAIEADIENTLAEFVSDEDQAQPTVATTTSVAIPAEAETAVETTTVTTTITTDNQSRQNSGQRTEQSIIFASTNSNTAQNNEATTDNGIRLVKTQRANTLNPGLANAFADLQAGDYDAARQQYQQVLTSDSNNRDALLGLASIYQKQNSTALAQNMYARLLQLNPRDPLARTGLLESTRATTDPLVAENQLKTLMEDNPTVAPLSFALGNLYASQQRWTEAESAYFFALTNAKSANAGPVSPDYAFNLAVSLERINQPAPAYTYYQEAQTLSRHSAPGFDPELLTQRLNYLEQVLR